MDSRAPGVGDVLNQSGPSAESSGGGVGGGGFGAQATTNAHPSTRHFQPWWREVFIGDLVRSDPPGEVSGLPDEDGGACCTPVVPRHLRARSDQLNVIGWLFW